MNNNLIMTNPVDGNSSAPTSRRWLAVTLLAFLLLIGIRSLTAVQQWQWFAENFPGLWQNTHITYSQDGNHYIAQALAFAKQKGPVWAEEAFFRPPLPSFYFQYLFNLTHFDLTRVSWLQSLVALASYGLLFVLLRRTFGQGIAVASLFVIATSSVLTLYDTSIEDSTIAQLLLVAGIYPLYRYADQLKLQHILFSGLMLALAVMCRPNIGLMVAMLAVWVWRFAPAPSGATDDQPPAGAPTTLSAQLMYFLLPAGGFLLLSAIYSMATSGALQIPRYAFGSTDNFGGPEYALCALILLLCELVLLRCFRRDGDLFSLLAAGFCVGMAGFLIRDVYLPGLLFAFLLLYQRGAVTASPDAAEQRSAPTSRLAHLCHLLLPLAAVIAFCAAHNYNELQKLSLITSTFGENVYWGTNANPDYRILMQGEDPERWLIPAEPHSRHQVYLRRHFPAHNHDDSLRLAAFHFIAEHPAEAARQFVEKLHRSFASFEFERNIDLVTLGPSATVFRWWHIPFGCLFGLAAVTMIMQRQHPQRKRLWLLFIPPLALVVTEALFFNASRYRSVGLPFLIPLALLGGQILWQSLRHAQFGKALLAALLVAGFWFVGHTATDRPLEDKYRSIGLYKLARMQLVEDGNHHAPGQMVLRDPALFLQRLDQALALYPDNISAFYLRTMYRIYPQNQAAAALADIQEWRNRCRPEDFACLDTTRVLLKIAGDPARFLREGPRYIERE